MGKEVKFTEEQQDVIDFTGNNLLVSAAAGSGKTTVMIQRVCDLITKKEVPINKFLIISFTKASASDMKNKLIKKLSSLEPTPFILEQLDDIMTSDVSNLHSFCARLLKSYFYEVGLDPTFVILDDEEVETLKEKALNKLFSEKSEKGDKDFYALVDIFSKSRKDTGLRSAILKLYNYLCSIVNRDLWFKSTIESLYNTNLNKNSGAHIINAHMKAEKLRCEELIKDMTEKCNSVGASELVSYLQSLDSVFKLIRVEDSFYENAKRLTLKERLPNIPKAVEGREFLTEEVKLLKESLMERFDKLKVYACSDEIEDVVSNLKITQKRLNDLYDLTLEFEKLFKTLKKEKGGLDFNDLEQYSLEVLSSETVIDEIKNKYEYVLVDEYQDINGVQEELLNRLSRLDNRFMVGDVKQSIYRFRLCDPEIFLEKYNKYQKDKTSGELIKLNANFRSKCGILDFVNIIFDNVMTENFGGVDYKKDARLIAGSDSQIDEEQRVQLLFADTQDNEKTKKEITIYSVKEDDCNQTQEKQGFAEGLMIANKISELLKNKKIKDGDTGRMRKIKFSDITILTQSRTPFLNKLTQVLEQKGIPVSTDIEGDCLEDEYVYGIRSFIESVACYKVDYSLFSCLYSKLFNFTANELAQIKLAGCSNDYFYKDVLNALDGNKLDKELQVKLNNFFNCLNEARQKASFLSAKEIVNDIVSKQQVRIKMSFEKDGEKRLQKLNRFIGSLGDQNIYEYLSDKGLSSVKCEPVYSGGAVKVMTIHKSKGLEFGVVFLVGVNRGFNFKTLYSDMVISKDLGVCIDYYDREQRYKTPTLARQAVKLIETRKMLEEQQRLLYVALTRATDYLYVVGSGEYSKIKEEMPISPSCFMDFMGGLFLNPQNYNEAKFDVVLTDANELIDCDEEKTVRDVIISDYDDESVQSIRRVFESKYKHSESINVPLKTAVTALAGENVENQTYEVLFDEDKSSAEIGTLNHKVMQYLSLTEKTEFEIKDKISDMLEKGIINDEDMDNIFVDGIIKLLSNKEFNLLIETANKVLKEREFYMALPANSYNNLANKEDLIVVQGIVDLCIINDNGITIVDYKTGALSNSDVVDKYKNQINLYADAMSKSFCLPINEKYIASLKTGKLIKFL